MGGHGPLGEAGGAARVEDRRQVIRTELGRLDGLTFGEGAAGFEGVARARVLEERRRPPPR